MEFSRPTMSFPRILDCRPGLGDMPSSLSVFYILSTHKQALKTPSMRPSIPPSILGYTSLQRAPWFPSSANSSVCPGLSCSLFLVPHKSRIKAACVCQCVCLDTCGSYIDAWPFGSVSETNESENSLASVSVWFQHLQVQINKADLRVL